MNRLFERSGSAVQHTIPTPALDGLSRESETHSNALADSAPVALYHYLAHDCPLRVNPEFRRVFGGDSNQSIAVWSENVHPEDRPRVQAAFTAFESQPITAESRFSSQYRTLSSTGALRFVLDTMVPAIGVQGYVGTITDITELVNAHAELERTHKALQVASRQAGMAEVATSVLHNIGNTLNSVNVSANLLDTRLRELRISGLARVATMLQERGEGLAAFLTTDERGKRFPIYLTELSSQLLADQEEALKELTSLVESIEHIKQIVAMQQSYATQCSVTETVAVADLVNDSVRLNAAAFSRHGVTLSLEFEEVPPITVDKHRILQILVNLIRNAKYACDESKRSDKQVTIRIRRCDIGVCIAIIDNGIGISAENMAQLFRHGFTTRPGGHGFGLHSAALAAKELKGSLLAASDGLNHGATFTLELPLDPPKRPP